MKWLSVKFADGRSDAKPLNEFGNVSMLFKDPELIVSIRVIDPPVSEHEFEEMIRNKFSRPGN